jgi:hypothetical protein
MGILLQNSYGCRWCGFRKAYPTLNRRFRRQT